MKWTGLNEIREQFLSFFESKGHTRLPSFPLIPQGDASLLLINAGMAPMKKYFLGQETPPNTRVTTCQKCIRTPDIERVGKTARHGTYFEMLGNFSFGDYFKKEAVAWAWEFCTEVAGLPKERLYVSVYHDDDEAYNMWTQDIGVAEDHMVRLGKEDNFWELPSGGPCGPCSEIHFDRGPENGCGRPDCKVGCDCDRYVEFWNLVFSQFNGDGNGNYKPMEKPNIDTGMGLERLACILQNVDNLFEVDTIQNIMNHICRIANVKYKENDKTDVSLRVITDHIRSTVFMVGDGVLPSNEGRGYVLRRLLRRAARHGRLLGIKEPFLYQAAETVIQENLSAYPELTEKKEYIQKIIRVEEENFARTVDKGMELLNRTIADTLASGSKILSGAETFKLSDTFGFPLDLTIEIAEEKGLTVDEETFRRLMEEQKNKARQDRASKGTAGWTGENKAVLSLPSTSFTGYCHLREEASVLGIFVDGQETKALAEGQEAVVVLSATPFYAESGGQAGDKGLLKAGESTFSVYDTKKTAGGQVMHFGVLEAGGLSEGDIVQAAVDPENRASTMRNHSAAHLLQAALREVLGDHVHQAGQLVDGARMRFDFSHFSAVTPEELRRVEDIVNQNILESHEVDVREMPIEEAKKIGAMALFGEKYGDVVRVVSMKDCSVELCGGTHVSNTAQLGLFKILSESSVAAGVRRIEAVTGGHVLALLRREQDTIAQAAGMLKATPGELVNRCESFMSEVKRLEKELSSLKAKQAAGALSGILENGFVMGGLRIVSGRFPGVSADELRTMGDQVKDMAADGVALLVSDSAMLCVCGKEAVDKGAHAGKLVKEAAALTGGKGGGRPDSAMAGIGDPSAVPEALEQFAGLVKAFLHPEK